LGALIFEAKMSVGLLDLCFCDMATIN